MEKNIAYTSVHQRNIDLTDDDHTSTKPESASWVGNFFLSKQLLNDHRYYFCLLFKSLVDAIFIVTDLGFVLYSRT